MDSFNGQITTVINRLLEQNHIHVCLLPPNTTDLLQPLDASVNKPAKDFLRQKFREWYSEKLIEQVREDDVDNVEINPVNLSMPVLKQVGEQWLVELTEYQSNNPQKITNGFINTGIAAALNGIEEESVPTTDSERFSSDDSEIQQ